MQHPPVPQPPGQSGDLSHASPGAARPRTPSGPQPPGSSSEALHQSSQKLPPTQLGVGPPPRPSARITPPAPTPRSRRAWLAVAALLAVGGGVALAIALTGP
jgi:hypothetical protein